MELFLRILSVTSGRSFYRNALLLNSSIQPDLTVSRTYSTPLCFQDGADKELFDPLPDIKVKVQSSFMVSLGVAERAEYHNKPPSDTYPRDVSRDYSGTAERRKKGLMTLNGPVGLCKEQQKISGVFGHNGGRLVVPNTGRWFHVEHPSIVWTKLPQPIPSLSGLNSQVILSQKRAVKN
ncbi:hypothetical protein NL108_016918 [Boleophthalmus pectinirostris]|nr:hypothetical protein NL108_016918 [Boleophthalmus pectinirostris]